MQPAPYDWLYAPYRATDQVNGSVARFLPANHSLQGIKSPPPRSFDLMPCNLSERPRCIRTLALSSSKTVSATTTSLLKLDQIEMQ